MLTIKLFNKSDMFGQVVFEEDRHLMIIYIMTFNISVTCKKRSMNITKLDQGTSFFDVNQGY